MGSPARSEVSLRLVSPPALVASSGLPPSSSELRPSPDVGLPSSLAAAPLTPSRMVGGGCSWVGSVSSPAGDTEVAGGHQGLPDLSLEGPFDVYQDRPVSGASPRVLDGMQGCQYRMTSYDQDSGGPDFSPAYGIQLHDPRLLEYVGAPESARLLSRSPEYWLHHLGHEKRLGAALQLQHDAGLILSNVQVLQQFVTSRVAFGRAPFPADAMQQVVPSYRVRFFLVASLRGVLPVKVVRG